MSSRKLAKGRIRAGGLICRAVLAAAGAGAIAPSAALAAPIEVTAFGLSPSCMHPGATVTGNDTVQTTTEQNQTFYVQTATSYFGVPVQKSQVYGPYITGPNTTSTTSTPTAVPWYAPYGSYTIVFGTGPSASDAMGWSTRSTQLYIEPWC
jgi:hypothetical protein